MLNFDFCNRNASIKSTVSLRLGLPTVVGELIAGVLLGPAILNWVQYNGIISEFANLGVICLMFIAGLESDLKLLERYFKPSIVVASVGAMFPMIAFPIIGYLAGLSISKALFLGVTFSATSVSISVEVLVEMHRLKTKEGITILGAAVADDITSVVLLGIVSTLTHQNVTGSKIQSFGLVVAMVAQIAYFILIWLLIKWAVPKVINWVQPFKFANRSKALISLIFCFGLSCLAEVTGLSSITGAFFAGLAISSTCWKQAVQSQILPFGHLLFIPVFFISIGLEMSIIGIVNDWGLLIILVITAILTKFLGAGTGALSCRYSFQSATIIGSGMISRGEVALIIAQLGYVHNLLSTDLYSTIISAIIITTILAPVIMKKLA